MAFSQDSERAEAASCISSGQRARGKLVEDLLAARRQVSVFLFDLEAHRGDDLVQARDDGRVRDAEVFFDVLDLAATADEDLDELELFARQAGQAAEGEVALEGGAARLTFESNDVQVVTADGTPGEDLVRGAVGSSAARTRPAIEFAHPHVEKINGWLEICQYDFRPGARSTSEAGHS